MTPPPSLSRAPTSTNSPSTTVDAPLKSLTDSFRANFMVWPPMRSGSDGSVRPALERELGRPRPPAAIAPQPLQVAEHEALFDAGAGHQPGAPIVELVAQRIVYRDPLLRRAGAYPERDGVDADE